LHFSNIIYVIFHDAPGEAGLAAMIAEYWRIWREWNPNFLLKVNIRRKGRNRLEEKITNWWIPPTKSGDGTILGFGDYGLKVRVTFPQKKPKGF
jgi:hypothetical protein